MKYIPFEGEQNNNDELTIRLVLHVMQKSDGTGNFQNTPADRYFLLHHYNSWVNWKLSGISDPVYSGQTYPNPPPGNSKLKVELLEEDILFWQDDQGWNNSGPGVHVACGFGSYVWDTYRMDEDCKMNVFLIEEGGSSQGCGPGYNGEANYFTILRNFYTDMNINPDTQGQKDIISTANAHEIAHNLGLGHTFSWSCNQCELFSDLEDYCPDTELNEGCNSETDPECSNNLMGPAIPSQKRFLSPHQYGHMRKMLLGTFRSKHLKANYDAGKTITLDGGNHLWDFARVSRGDVILKNGAVLTIKCKVIMAPGSRIVVEAGTRLILDGAYLTGAKGCNGDHWQGIIVEGQTGLSQQYDIYNQTYYQGLLRILPGSVIEGALTAVECQVPGSNFHTGGIVQADGATFLNCKHRFVHIRDFQNTSLTTGQPIGNASYFSECSFILDDDYAGNFQTDFHDMVRLRQVNGIRFIGCNFANGIAPTATPFADGRKFGIYSVNAGFSVTGQCNSNTYPCSDYTNGTFSGFNRAIYSGVMGSAWPISVSNTNFRDNLMAIDATAVPGVFLVNNNIYVGSTQPPSPYFGGGIQPNRGVMLTQCTGYKIEGNNLFEFPAAGTTVPVGILANSSGQMPNEIYRNRFEDLHIGNLSNGRNRHHDPTFIQGLQYLCNTNTGNQGFDFAVPEEKGAVGFGIREDQGAAAQAAGNVFTAVGGGSGPELHFHNKQNDITYFYFNQTNQAPTNITPLKVTPTNTFSNNTCLSKLPTDKEEGLLAPTEKQQFQQEFNNLNSPLETRYYAGDMLLRHYLLDTAGVDLAAARIILDGKGDLYARFVSVDTWLQEKNDTAAQDALAAIPSQIVLTDEAQTEYDHFYALKTLQIGALESGDDDETLVTNHYTALVNIAEAGPYFASAQAGVLLNSVQGFSYAPEAVLPEGGQAALMAPLPGGPAPTVTAYAALEALPNPALHEAVFRYRLPEGTETARIVVTDVYGSMVADLKVEGGNGNLVWGFQGLKGGLYLYSLVSDKKTLLTKKLVITH